MSLLIKNKQTVKFLVFSIMLTALVGVFAMVLEIYHEGKIDPIEFSDDFTRTGIVENRFPIWETIAEYGYSQTIHPTMENNEVNWILQQYDYYHVQGLQDESIFDKVDQDDPKELYEQRSRVIYHISVPPGKPGATHPPKKYKEVTDILSIRFRAELYELFSLEQYAIRNVLENESEQYELSFVNFLDGSFHTMIDEYDAKVAAEMEKLSSLYSSTAQ